MRRLAGARWPLSITQATPGPTYSSPFYWNAPANLNSFKVFKFTIQVYLVNLNKI